MNASYSPIARLPCELLSEIFLLCSLSVEQTENDIKGANSCMTVNPFGLECNAILSTVCRKWRNIIYNQANLWSNICINQNMLTSRDHLGTLLDTNQIKTCLERSRRYPLNILIDARDPDWNWTEEGVGIHATEADDDDEFAMVTELDEELMPVLFSSQYMTTAISLLLPHLSRWKSLVILTDTWAPMHDALRTINPAITHFGAPMLETLALLRCNELPSYFHEFQPANLKDLAFLSGDDLNANILPRLRSLSLEGVHVDWDALSSRLAASSGILENLELRYHPAEVRPTLHQYRKILGSAPSLQKLAIKCSGAYIPKDFVLPSNYVPVSLPSLKELSLGYQTSEDGEVALELFDAPNVTHLTLEDSSHYASADQYADDMLAYLASKACYSNTTDSEEEVLRKASLCDTPTPREHSVASPKRAYFSEDPRPPFPFLETISLNRVDGTAEAFHSFFRALDRIQHVEISNMTMDALRALLPSVGPRGPTCPCPQLRSVRVHDTQKSTPQEFEYYFNALMNERPKYNYSLPTIDLHLAECSELSPRTDEELDTGSVMDSEDDDEDSIFVADSPILSSAYRFEQHNLKDQESEVLRNEELFFSTFGSYYSSPITYQ